MYKRTLLAGIAAIVFAATGALAANPMSARDVIGAGITDGQNKSVGTVKDLIIGDNDKVDLVVVSVGGILGIGDKLVAVPYDELHVADNSGNTFMINASKAQLEAMPEFKYEKSGAAIQSMSTTTGTSTGTTTTSSSTVGTATTSGSSATGTQVATTGDYQADHDAFVKQYGGQVDEWDAKVAAYTGKAAAATDKAQQEMATKVNAAWTDVKSEWKELQSATAEKWDTTKKSFQRAWDSFSQTWKEANPS